MSDQNPKTEALERRLERLSTALGTPKPAAPLAPTPAPAQPPARNPAREAGAAGMTLAVALVVAAVATGHPAMIVLALLMGIASGVALLGGAGHAVLSSVPAGLAPADPHRPRVGMGASIADDAVIEPGATVEMGASVGKGAIIRRGAVVRMGSSVRSGAVLEEGAVVGWGCTVGKGAVVGRAAVVGAGSTIKAGAQVPEGMQLPPGANWGAKASTSAGPTPARPAPAPVAVDPRLARIDAACERIGSELAQAPEQVRAHLGASAQVAATLRQTCHGLVERERLLRTESSPEALAFLEQERAELERRIASAADEAVRRSLQSAVAAIDDQRRQRQHLARSADRLGAELTRLQYTLEGMATQLVRLRTAGGEATADPAALQSMEQLHGEIDAIADALEEVARADQAEAAGLASPAALGPAPVTEVASPVDEASRSPGSKERI